MSDEPVVVKPYVKDNGTAVDKHTRKKPLKPAATKLKGTLLNPDLKNVSNKSLRAMLEPHDSETPEKLGAAEKKVTEADAIMFALEYPEWSSRGFSSIEECEIWISLGYDANESDANKKPFLTQGALYHLVSNYEVDTLPFDEVDMSKLTSLTTVFSACAFNADVSGLDTSNVESLMTTFQWNQTFNQPLDQWDISKVTVANHTFFGASSFDQSLATWDISSIRSAERMLTGSGMSKKNLSDTFVGWAETAREKGAQRNIDFVAIPHEIEELTDEAQRAVAFLQGAFGWKFQH